MPELPEVEAARRLAEAHAVGKTITKATAADDDKVVQVEGGARALEAALTGARVTAAERRGKHLWLELGPPDSGQPALLLHFGMTGHLCVAGVAAPRYRSLAVDEGDWPPRFWKLLLECQDGTRLAFCDSRRFARIRLQVDPLAHEPLSKLGFDVLLSLPPEAELGALLARQRRAIKAVLLDQSVAAGVGNWVADEVLYQARIHPAQRADSLSAAQVAALHAQLHNVPQVAVEADADSSRFPAEWLFHCKWDSRKKTAPKLGGHSVQFSEVAGRTTAYVPALQKLPAGAQASADAEQEDAQAAPQKAGGKQKRKQAGPPEPAGEAGVGQAAPARKRKQATDKPAGEAGAGQAAPARKRKQATDKPAVGQRKHAAAVGQAEPAPAPARQARKKKGGK